MNDDGPFESFLDKAFQDDFDYALKLRTGDIIRFRSATDLGNGFIRLDLTDAEQPATGKLPYPSPRGIDVRHSDIVWVVDAPEGS